MWASSLATVQQKSKIHPLYLFVLRFFRKCVPGCAFVMSQWASISSLIYLQGISLVRFHSVVGQKVSNNIFKKLWWVPSWNWVSPAEHSCNAKLCNQLWSQQDAWYVWGQPGKNGCGIMFKRSRTVLSIKKRKKKYTDTGSTRDMWVVSHPSGSHLIGWTSSSLVS